VGIEDGDGIGRVENLDIVTTTRATCGARITSGVVLIHVENVAEAKATKGGAGGASRTATASWASCSTRRRA